MKAKIACVAIWIIFAVLARYEILQILLENPIMNIAIQLTAGGSGGYLGGSAGKWLIRRLSKNTP